jgi:hypothetical protein
MSSSQFSLLARVSTTYSQLSSVAADLNAVSDALGKAVSDIDEGLKKLNLGVSAWVQVSGSDPSHEDSTYEINEIGYDKVAGKWGIALRTRSGDANHPEDTETVEEWPFNEATRASRLRAIDKIPELLNKLNNEATKVTKDLQEKLTDAQSVASAVKMASAAGIAKSIFDPLTESSQLARRMARPRNLLSGPPTGPPGTENLLSGPPIKPGGKK